MTTMLQWSCVGEWNRQYGPLGYPWGNDAESGHRLVEGVYLPPRTEPPLVGAIEIEVKSIKEVVDKKTGETKFVGKGETKEDWTAQVQNGDRLRMQEAGIVFDVLTTRVSAPKYAGSGTKSKFIFGSLEFEFIDVPPNTELTIFTATVARVVIDCVIPRIPKETKLDQMVKDRYLSGDTTTWDITTCRQFKNGLAPPGSGYYRLLLVPPSVNVRGKGYTEANSAYMDALSAGTLTDADHVEWITLIRNHQQHHADGYLEETEYKYASAAAHAFIDNMTCLADEQRVTLRGQIRRLAFVRSLSASSDQNA